MMALWTGLALDVCGTLMQLNKCASNLNQMGTGMETSSSVKMTVKTDAYLSRIFI